MIFCYFIYFFFCYLYYLKFSVTPWLAKFGEMFWKRDATQGVVLEEVPISTFWFVCTRTTSAKMHQGGLNDVFIDRDKVARSVNSGLSVRGWVRGWVSHADISGTVGPIWLKFCRLVVMFNETKRNFFFVNFFLSYHKKTFWKL